MSHSEARIRFRDGDTWFAEYDGTADQILARIFATRDELNAEWRRGATEHRECSCGHEPELAEYAESYGGGSYGTVKACRNCSVIVDSAEFYELEDFCAWGPNQGSPSWWP